MIEEEEEGRKEENEMEEDQNVNRFNKGKLFK